MTGWREKILTLRKPCSSCRLNTARRKIKAGDHLARGYVFKHKGNE